MIIPWTTTRCSRGRQRPCSRRTPAFPASSLERGLIETKQWRRAGMGRRARSSTILGTRAGSLALGITKEWKATTRTTRLLATGTATPRAVLPGSVAITTIRRNPRRTRRRRLVQRLPRAMRLWRHEPLRRVRIRPSKHILLRLAGELVLACAPFLRCTFSYYFSNTRCLSHTHNLHGSVIA